jgi:hypothetical protein
MWLEFENKVTAEHLNSLNIYIISKELVQD